ncbi:hypothetical protein [Aeromicrobium sp.]|uniref:hypothetical protein n=1 Tax=Aeromicrobium sp. TaxID=1871063 RepID=UPI0030C0F0F2
MIYVLAAFALIVLVLTVVLAVTGRIKPTNCCSVADPSKDLRMRAAFEDQTD